MGKQRDRRKGAEWLPLPAKARRAKRRAPSNPPDYRTGVPGDPSPWTPARTYRHLCQCFRRQLGALSLTQEEYKAASAEYVVRALQTWKHQWQFQAPAAPARPRRRYVRNTRKSALDSQKVSKDPCLRELRLRQKLAGAEFAWIILRGETKALKVRSRERVKEMLRAKYPFLPQVHRECLLEDLETSPYHQASQEVAEELNVEPESLRVLLAPSQRRRASLPPAVSRLLRE